MSHPIVSVIIPTFNRRNLIKRAVISVCSQTFTDVEIIVVDDGSTDDTSAMVASLPDDRIIYLRHEESKGPAAARNTGMKHARGSYIAFLDSDDAWYPEKIEKQLKAFTNVSTTPGLVYTGATRINPNSETEHILPVFRGNLVRKLLISNVVGSPTGVMITSKVPAVVGFFDERLKGREDLDYWVRIAQQFEIDFVAEELVYLYTESTGRVSFNPRIVDAYDYFLQKHRLLFKQHRCTAEHVRRGAKFIYLFTKDRSSALRHLRHAIRECPVDLVAWFNYIRYMVQWK